MRTIVGKEEMLDYLHKSGTPKGLSYEQASRIFGAIKDLIRRADDYTALIAAARDVEESGINFTYPRFYEIQVDKSVWNELKSALARVEEET